MDYDILNRQSLYAYIRLRHSLSRTGASIVEKPEEYLYSSARNYADLDGMIDVIRIDTKWITIS